MAQHSMFLHCPTIRAKPTLHTGVQTIRFLLKLAPIKLQDVSEGGKGVIEDLITLKWLKNKKKKKRKEKMDGGCKT